MATGSKPGETSIDPPASSGARKLVISPMMWNIGESQRKTLRWLTRPSTPKFTAVARALASVMMTPFGRPEVPEV